MRKKSNFNFAKGRYYFTVKSSPNNITMYRSSKNEAVTTFLKYIQIGKDCEWHGIWEGKKWGDSTAPSA